MINREIAVRTAGLAVALLAGLFPLSAAVTVYPSYPSEPASTQFTATADGQAILVHNSADFQSIDFARFTFTGSVTVAVTLKSGTLDSCSISPRSYNIAFTKSGSTVTFTLNQPRKLFLFFSGGRKMALFAEAPEVNPPKLGDANVKNIKDYSVDTTGATVQTTKINNAIAELSALGGKRILYFPRGVYLTGTIRMKSNVTLYLAPDALITASTNTNDYATIPNYGYGNSAFVFFDSTNNAGIMGRGTMCARGFSRKAIGMGRDVHGYKLHSCKNTVFNGVYLLDSYTWTWHPVDCDTISATNTKIINMMVKWWDDGYDFDVTRDGLVEDCFFYGADDATCIKGSPRVPLKSNERITFRNCVLYSWANGVRYGYSSEANWSYSKNIRFENNQYVCYGADGVERGIKLDCGAAPSDSIFVINCAFERAPEAGVDNLFGIYGSKVGYVLFDHVVSYRPDNRADIQTGAIEIRCMTLNGTAISSRTDAISKGILGSNSQATVLPCSTPAINRPVGERTAAPAVSVATAQENGMLLHVNSAGAHRVDVLNISGSMLKSFSGTGVRAYSLGGLGHGLCIVKSEIDGVRQTREIILR